MQDRFKFRVWRRHNSGILLKYIVGWEELPATAGSDVAPIEIVEQCTGLKDKNGTKLFFAGDIGEFDNGDRFIIRIEEWAEFYVEWIYEPECEDQASDLYRIQRAKVIGNVHENPDLLTV